MNRRVVLDTNVYISALLFGGLPGSISLSLLDELEEKLLLKFNLAAVDCAAIRAKLLRTVELVTPDFLLEVIEDDPDDNRVLECAVAGRGQKLCRHSDPDRPAISRWTGGSSMSTAVTCQLSENSNCQPVSDSQSHRFDPKIPVGSIPAKALASIHLA